MHYKVRCWSLSQENKYAFNARRNCWMVRSDWRRLDERLFHSRSPATGNDLETRQLYCNLVEYYSFVWREWKWRTVVWKLRIEYKPKKGDWSAMLADQWAENGEVPLPPQAAETAFVFTTTAAAAGAEPHLLSATMPVRCVIICRHLSARCSARLI